MTPLPFGFRQKKLTIKRKQREEAIRKLNPWITNPQTLKVLAFTPSLSLSHEGQEEQRRHR